MDQLFTSMFLGQLLWMWLTFVTAVIVLLAFDAGVLHKDNYEIFVRERLLLSGGVLYSMWRSREPQSQALVNGEA